MLQVYNAYVNKIRTFPVSKLRYLDDNIWFPPPEDAQEDGLLAFGGDLSEERLLVAYRSGIFPWFEDELPWLEESLPLWWHPDPRFVLYPKDLKISKSMRKILEKSQFEFKVNSDFEQVIRACQKINRKNQDGTWITNSMVAAYSRLHLSGYAFSAEAWLDGKLVGGLYGVLIGKVFFGESMFSHASNASKFAFIKWIKLLENKGIELIDCQMHTPHLESLGAVYVPRKKFMDLLNQFIPPLS